MSVSVENIDTIRQREAPDQDEVELRFNEQVIPISLRFRSYVASLQAQVEYLEQRVVNLESKSVTLHIDDRRAEILIVDYIRQIRKTGSAFVDVLDVASTLKLPLEQASRILEKLKSRGLKEAD